MLEVVVGARARRVERAELTEELEARPVELELVLHGRGLALEGRSLLGLGPDAGPQPLDVLLSLPDGRLERLLLLRATPGRARGDYLVAAEQRRLGARHVERTADQTERGLLVGVTEHAAAVHGAHDDSRLAIPRHCAIQGGQHLVR